MSNPIYSELLRNMAEKLNVIDVYDELIKQYPQFEYWAGSHNKMLHHYERYGLIRHTWEIVEMGLHIIPMLNLCDKVNPVEYYLAALFHDTGKMYDYAQDGDGWKATEHKRLIYHLPKSILIWHDVVGKFPELSNKCHDFVTHAILAHHGNREFGSPVAPKTRVAWLLHLCDSISARMDDAERLDVMKSS